MTGHTVGTKAVVDGGPRLGQGGHCHGDKEVGMGHRCRVEKREAKR